LIEVGHQITNAEHDTGMLSAYIVSVTHQVFIGTNTFSTTYVDRYKRYILRPIHVVRSSLVLGIMKQKSAGAPKEIFLYVLV
jgi:hypothetical protein